MTLERIQQKAQHGSKALYRQARHILLDDAFLIYLRFTVQYEGGGRPQWESLSQFSDVQHTEEDLADIVAEFTPGEWVTLMEDTRTWYRARVRSCQVTYWAGSMNITGDGLLKTPDKPQRKPGPAAGSKATRTQPRSGGKFTT